MRRRFLKLLPFLVCAPLAAQISHPDVMPVPGVPDDGIILPNGKRQRDEILRLDYDRNLKDARDLMDLARTLQQEVEKNGRPDLKKLDDIEKIARRIRNRMKH
jgi:hypothetical protein